MIPIDTIFFQKNVLMNTLIVKYAYESGVENFLGILSNTVYSDTIKNFPLKESLIHDGSPHKDLLSYAFATTATTLQSQFWINDSDFDKPESKT